MKKIGIHDAKIEMFLLQELREGSMKKQTESTFGLKEVIFSILLDLAIVGLAGCQPISCQKTTDDLNYQINYPSHNFPLTGIPIFGGETHYP